MSRSEKKFGCVSCGDELHPERAKKYDYCMKPECQAKNLKGLTMVAVGVNKSAEQYLLLDEDTKAELAQGKYHDQRRGTFGQPEPAPGPPRTASPAAPAPDGPPRRPPRPAPARRRPAGREQRPQGAPVKPPRSPPGAAAAGHGVAAPAGGPVQPAGPAAGRDRPQAGAEPVRRHADHPGGAHREELRPGGPGADPGGPRAPGPERPAARSQPPSANSARTPSSRTGRRSVNRSSAASAASRMASPSAVGPGSDRE